MSSATEPAPRRVVLPGVFRPRSDTWLLARAACRQPLPAGARVLELCAGPAVAGIAVARERGATLTTVDVSRRAVLNARLNARMNRVAIRARRGDLLAAVDGERFDLIIANPPYVPGPRPPSGGAARAWDAGPDGRAILDRICAAAPAHLAPGGILLLVHSEVCDPDATLAAYVAAGLAADVAARQRGSLGPLLRKRRTALEAAGLLRAGQAAEDVLVLRGRAGA
jgi:release factor glutamine methyltransferase